MINKKLQTGFFYILLLGVFIIALLIFWPFLKVLFLASVFAVVFYPLYKKFVSWFSFKGDKAVSALFTVLIVLLVILLPCIGLGFLIFQEINNVYFDLIANTNNNSIISFLTQSGNYINQVLPFDIVPELSTENIQGYAEQAYQWILGHFGSLFSSVFKIVLSTFIMILALFFFLRDGEKFKNNLISLSPLRDTYDEDILAKIKLAINSVIKGSLLIAIIQGILATIGFGIFGVPSAILWGAVAVLAAIIPSVGTAIVILPAVIFLFFTKSAAAAIGLLIWGIVIVGLVDNVLAPFVLERGIKIHPFLILLSVLGGLSLFGPIGFLAGPVILSLLLHLLRYIRWLRRIATDNRGPREILRLLRKNRSIESYHAYDNKHTDNSPEKLKYFFVFWVKKHRIKGILPRAKPRRVLHLILPALRSVMSAWSGRDARLRLVIKFVFDDVILSIKTGIDNGREIEFE